VRGFDTATVYRTYDEYVNENERYFLEYFLRDAYAYYHYDFISYDGAPVNVEKANELIDGFSTMDNYIRRTWENTGITLQQLALESEPEVAGEGDSLAEEIVRGYNTNRKEYARILLRGLRFVNKRGQALEFTPMLQPDPDLLDQPLYH
ncbi:MAG: hypothetical protein IJQ98_13560, partial [Oscillospiraceae bacterium]|nr:hypothetical protein [Oscillospiraceae bacterium]